MSVLTLLLTEFLFIGALDWTLNGNYKMVERLRPDMAEAFGINQQQSGTENERVEMLGNISVRPKGVGGGGSLPSCHFKRMSGAVETRELWGVPCKIFT